MSEKRNPAYTGNIEFKDSEGVEQKLKIALWDNGTVLSGIASSYDGEKDVPYSSITVFPKKEGDADNLPAFSGFLCDKGAKNDDGTYAPDVRRAENLGIFVKGGRFDVAITVKGEEEGAKYEPVGNGKMFNFVERTAKAEQEADADAPAPAPAAPEQEDPFAKGASAPSR